MVIGLMKNKLSGIAMKKLSALRPKTYRYLADNNDKDKKTKSTKKRVINTKCKFKDYKIF